MVKEVNLAVRPQVDFDLPGQTTLLGWFSWGVLFHCSFMFVLLAVEAQMFDLIRFPSRFGNNTVKIVN